MQTYKGGYSVNLKSLHSHSATFVFRIHLKMTKIRICSHMRCGDEVHVSKINMYNSVFFFFSQEFPKCRDSHAAIQKYIHEDKDEPFNAIFKHMRVL